MPQQVFAGIAVECDGRWSEVEKLKRKDEEYLLSVQGVDFILNERTAIRVCFNDPETRHSDFNDPIGVVDVNSWQVGTEDTPSFTFRRRKWGRMPVIIGDDNRGVLFTPHVVDTLVPEYFATDFDHAKSLALERKAYFEAPGYNGRLRSRFGGVSITSVHQNVFSQDDSELDRFLNELEDAADADDIRSGTIEERVRARAAHVCAHFVYDAEVWGKCAMHATGEEARDWLRTKIAEAATVEWRTTLGRAFSWLHSRPHPARRDRAGATWVPLKRGWL